MQFRILGPLEVAELDRTVPLGGAQQRAVLAVLLLRRREVVSTDRLIDELWGGRPPATAAKTVQGYVSHLRKALGADLLITHGRGYLLAAEPGQVDVDRFEALADEGHRALDAGEARRASELLGEALALWRGPALADFAYESFAQAEIGRLEEARLAALEDRIDADLALGRHAQLVGELESLVRQHPLRERLQGQLMLALYRSGRQADSLDRYRQARQAMVDELGLEPVRPLQELEQQILAQDPALEAPAQPSPLARALAGSRLRGAILIAGGGLALLAAAIAAVAISSGGGSAIEVAPNSVAVIDTGTDKLTADVPVGVQPADIAAGEHGVWVANGGDATVSRIDPRTRRVSETIAPRSAVAAVAAGQGAVWTSDDRRGVMARIDPVLRRVDRTIRIGPHAGYTSFPAPTMATGAGSVWIHRGGDSVVRVDPSRLRVQAHFPGTGAGSGRGGIAVGDGGVWVANGNTDTVTRIDPSTNGIVSTIPAGRGPRGIAVGAGGVWVADTLDNTVVRIDPDTNSVTGTIAVGTAPTGVAVGAGAVWVANSGNGTVSRIDPPSGSVAATIGVGQSPQSLAVAGGAVWVSVEAVPRSSSESAVRGEGGAARIVMDTGESTDPAIAVASPITYATSAQLLNYPDRPFPSGARLEPEVARGMPAVTDGGRTYTFRLRHGFRFSPPSNRPVTAAAFRRAIERALDPRMQSAAGALIRDIAGAHAYQAGRTRHVGGVTARGNRLTIKLIYPSPSLPARLAAPAFSAVPPGTPVDPSGVDRIPSAGPYYVASDVGGRLVLRPNPGYGGDRPQRLSEIDLINKDTEPHGVAQVGAGNADALALTPGQPGVERIQAQYGPHSDAASSGDQRVFAYPALATSYLVMNVRHGLFSSTRMRQAVNYAIDRRALSREPPPSWFGQPTDQSLPPGMTGFRHASIYPLKGPDVATARRLAGSRGGHVVMYTCNLPSCLAVAQIVRKNLGAIGVAVEIRQFPYDTLYNRLWRPGEPWDVADTGWIAEYADPSEFLNVLYGPINGPRVAQFVNEGNEDSFNLGRFGGPEVQRSLLAADKLSGPRRYRAYDRLDAALARNAAPLAAYATDVEKYFFSARMGCQLVQPVYRLDLAALCTRP